MKKNNQKEFDGTVFAPSKTKITTLPAEQGGDMTQTKQQLFTKLSYLEFVHDQLTAELQYIDLLLRSLGFPCGLESARLVAQEIVEQSFITPIEEMQGDCDSSLFDENEEQ